MKLEIFTILLDGLPYLGWHLPVLNRLPCDWHWTIAEGAAMNVRDTAWCQQQVPRLSRDGSHAVLEMLLQHPRVTVIRRHQWAGKTEQCNACIEHIKEPSVLLQMDADEVWQAETILAAVTRISSGFGSLLLRCRYFVGPNLVTVGHDAYGNRPGEWRRAWRFLPGARFVSHEPPVLSIDGGGEVKYPADITFDHYAYVSEAQVRYKEAFYGYRDALKHWRRLQANTQWPARLKDFLPWVKDGVLVEPLFKK